MNVKTSELIGPALDWAVCEVLETDYFYPDTGPSKPEYSTDWSQGGPIIDRYRIAFTDLFTLEKPEYQACIGTEYPFFFGYGPTHLVAAMRCFVASKLGDEVDIPRELVQ